MEFNKRLELLIEIEGGLTSFCKKVGFATGYVATTLRRNTSISVEKAKKILDAYPNLSTEWLMMGVGEMWMKDEKAASNGEARSSVEIEKDGRRRVYFIQDIKASGGYLGGETGTGSGAYIALSLPGIEQNAIAIEVHGSSMAPAISEGDIVIGTPVERDQPLREAVPYIIVHRLDGVTVKYIRFRTGTSHATLYAANDAIVRPYNVRLTDIVQLYEVKKVLKNI